jgi:hypothetical protein
MEELGDDLEHYLNEAGMGMFDKSLKKKKPEEKVVIKKAQMPASAYFEPFTALFGGVGDMIKAFGPSKAPKAKYDKGKKSKAEKGAHGAMWQAYKNYKKSHGLLSW